MLVILTLLVSYPQISGVGHETETLTEDQDGIYSEDCVRYNNGTSEKRKPLEPRRQFRFSGFFGIVPLIEKPEGEDDLAG